MSDALTLSRTARPAAPRAGSVPAVSAATAPVAAAPTMAIDARATAPQDADVTGLTPEEAQFVRQGWLREDFAALRAAQRTGGVAAATALARKGVKGPFTRDYGNPDRLLDAARRWQRDPELARMVQAIQPGDILVMTYNKDDDVISVATKGPFVHAAICVSAGAPPEFVEAIGLTGDMSDPQGNKVLRSQMADHASSGETVRLIRPTATLAPAEAEKAVKRAIAYAQAQLGKPYDFAFTEKNGQGWNDAFYCSELAYKAYTDPKGADLPIALDKSAGRDVATTALAKLIAGLRPDDAGALSFKCAQLSANKALTTDQLVAFIAQEVLPATAATREIADTPARRAALEGALRQVLDGKAFGRFQQELRTLTADDQRGAHAGVGGFFRRVSNIASLSWAAVADARAITKGIGFWRSIGTAWRVGQAVVPHLDVLSKFFFGAADARTVQAGRTLDQLDGLARDMRRVPLVGRFWPLPSRPRPEGATRAFVSPTDLGWANAPHFDFNVKPGKPIDKPAVEARKPPYMR